MSAPPVALTIAGSDSSAGAGLQADLLAFQAARVHGLTVATAIVAERPGAVLELAEVPAPLVARQLEALVPAFPVAAAKTGLLPSAAIITVVARHFRNHPVPLVVDPVAIASTGTRLASPEAEGSLLSFIREHATLVTPNRGEAQHLLGATVGDEREARMAALALRDDLGCAVLLKGGHFEGSEAIDWLADGTGCHPVSSPRLAIGDIHGTGCCYSAAITARLALGLPLLEAVLRARRHLHRSLLRHLEWSGHGQPFIKALAQAPEP